MSSDRYSEEFKIEAVKHIVDYVHSASSVATRIQGTLKNIFLIKSKRPPS